MAFYLISTCNINFTLKATISAEIEIKIKIYQAEPTELITRSTHWFCSSLVEAFRQQTVSNPKLTKTPSA